MNASKETCRQIKAAFDDIVEEFVDPCEVPGGSYTSRKINSVREFLDAAEKKLPSEAAYAKEKERRRG